MVKNKKIEQYEYIAILIGSTILVIVLLAILGIRPIYNNLSKRSEELKAKKNTLSALETKLENLKNLKEKEAEIKEQNEKVLAALPEDKDVSRLFNQVESIAKAAGIKIEKVTEKKEGETATQSTVIKPVAYQITGVAPNYFALKDTLAQIEKALRLVSVNKFSTDKGNEGIDLDFTFKTFIRGTN